MDSKQCLNCGRDESEEVQIIDTPDGECLCVVCLNEEIDFAGTPIGWKN